MLKPHVRTCRSVRLAGVLTLSHQAYPYDIIVLLACLKDTSLVKRYCSSSSVCRGHVLFPLAYLCFQTDIISFLTWNYFYQLEGTLSVITFPVLLFRGFVLFVLITTEVNWT